MRLILLLSLSTVFSIPSLRAGVTRKFHVADYGATGDGKTDDGPAIQKSFNAAKMHAGPTSVIFKKKNYLLGDNPNAFSPVQQPPSSATPSQ